MQRPRTDGVYVGVDEFATYVFRFLEDDLVLSAAIGEEDLPNDWVPTWLNLDWAEESGEPVVRCVFAGDSFEFTEKVGDGTLKHLAHLAGDDLVIDWVSSVTGQSGRWHCSFRAFVEDRA